MLRGQHFIVRGVYEGWCGTARGSMCQARERGEIDRLVQWERGYAGGWGSYGVQREWGG